MWTMTFSHFILNIFISLSPSSILSNKFQFMRIKFKEKWIWFSFIHIQWFGIWASTNGKKFSSYELFNEFYRFQCWHGSDSWYDIRFDKDTVSIYNTHTNIHMYAFKSFTHYKHSKYYFIISISTVVFFITLKFKKNAIQYTKSIVCLFYSLGIGLTVWHSFYNYIIFSSKCHKIILIVWFGSMQARFGWAPA